MSESLRVLLVEDNLDDVALVERNVGRVEDAGIALSHAPTLGDALARLADEAFDAVLLDLQLPDSAELEGFIRIQETAPDVAVVVLSGHRDRATALEAVRRGAQDYLLKDRADGEIIVRAVRYAVERKRTAARLQSVTDELNDLYEHAPCGYLSVNGDSVVIQINRTALGWLGRDRQDVVGKLKLWDVISTRSFETFQQIAHRFREVGYVRDVEVDIVRRDGATFPVLLSATALSNAYGAYVKTRFMLLQGAQLPRMEPSALPPPDAEVATADESLPGDPFEVCVTCKRVHVEQNAWLDLEVFLREQLDLPISQTLCPECAKRPHGGAYQD